MSLSPPGQESPFPQLRLRRLARTRSTQDVVLRAARGGAAEGFCCLADEQSQGRGRQGRAWVAAPGTAMLGSVLLRRAPRQAPGIPLAAGLAVIDALETLGGFDVRLKWPNDVLTGGGKLAGILTEVEPQSTTSQLVAVVVGIGLNLRVERFPDAVRGASLHTLTAKPPAAEALFRVWLQKLGLRLQLLEDAGIPGLAVAWRQHATGLGETVTVHGPAGTITGVAVDIDSTGALLVEGEDGPVRVLAGDVHLEPPRVR